MIGLEGNTAYSNYEQQVLQFFQGCVLPWVRRIELEVERKLLNEEKNLQCRFNVDGLLRADSSSCSSSIELSSLRVSSLLTRLGRKRD